MDSILLIMQVCNYSENSQNVFEYNLILFYGTENGRNVSHYVDIYVYCIRITASKACKMSASRQTSHF